MPVYLFTLHGYKTWMPDHPRGYYQRGKGYHAPDEQMAARYEQRARFDQVQFNPPRQRVLLDAAEECSRAIGVRLYYAVCVNTHLHLLTAWRDDRSWEVVHDRLKRILAFKLAESQGVRGRRWFSHRRVGDPVTDPDHLAYLLTEYLPDHHGETHRDLLILQQLDPNPPNPTP